MQICPAEPHPREQPPSNIEASNKFRLGHDECCNCCCCCSQQNVTYKYIQPEVPKSFAPIKYYWKPDVPIDDNTTYRLSYYDCPTATTEPTLPKDCLTVDNAPMSDETTHKMSYMGNWCVEPEQPIIPCDKQLLGRGPIQDVTTQKHDFSWKVTKPPTPIKPLGNINNACDAFDDDTTYRMSFYPSNCTEPVQSFAPVRLYNKAGVPMEDCTTYKLSYWPTEVEPVEAPWREKNQYCQPSQPIESCTTYALSYWPTSQDPEKPIVTPDNPNILNAKCCSDNNTTYGLSYFGCDGDASECARPVDNLAVTPGAFENHTTNKLSYLGNWRVQREQPIIPCDKQILGRGPMQDVTTNKHDFTWKEITPEGQIIPEPQLGLSPMPLDCWTTHKLSFIPNDFETLSPNPSFRPIKQYLPSCIPMECETTMKLSYQPVEAPETTSAKKVEQYRKPVTPMEDCTTQKLSFAPPGILVPLSPCNPSCESPCDGPCPPTMSCAV